MKRVFLLTVFAIFLLVLTGCAVSQRIGLPDEQKAEIDLNKTTYYGKYSGCDIYFIPGNAAMTGVLEVGGYKFIHAKAFSFRVEKDGGAYGLFDAYIRDLLSNDDIAELYRLHKYYETRYNDGAELYLQYDVTETTTKAVTEKPAVTTAPFPRVEPSTELEFTIGQNVNGFDFSGYNKRTVPLSGFIATYYGTGYYPTSDEGGRQIDPTKRVAYCVGFDLERFEAEPHILKIEITDPNVDFFGITLNNSPKEVVDILENCGFEIVNGLNTSENVVQIEIAFPQFAVFDDTSSHADAVDTYHVIVTIEKGVRLELAVGEIKTPSYHPFFPPWNKTDFDDIRDYFDSYDDRKDPPIILIK